MSTAVQVSRDPRSGDNYSETFDPHTYQVTASLSDVYKVFFNDHLATPMQALAALDPNDGTAIPRIMAEYEFNPGSGLYCLKRAPRRSPESPRMFIITVDFQNIIPKSGDKWNINISVKAVRYEQDAWVDANGKSVVNSAFQTFNPTLKRIYFDEEVHITFDTASGQGVIDSCEACKGHYNAAATTMTVNGVSRPFAAGTLLFGAPDYSTIMVGSPPYDWKFDFIFYYRKDGWTDQVVDRGYYIIDSNNKKVILPDANGIHHGEPILLDGKGGALTLPTPPALVTAKTITFDMHGSADFTALLAGIT